MPFEFANMTAHSQIKHVVRCDLCDRNKAPLKVEGKGESGILIVFGQPSVGQTERKSWFGCRAGFDAHDYKSGEPVFYRMASWNNKTFSPFKECWATGVFPCVGASVSEDKLKYEQCLPNLLQTIQKCQPRVIITVGKMATGAVLRCYNPLHFKANCAPATYVGEVIPLNMNYSGYAWNSWLVPIQTLEETKSEISYLSSLSAFWRNKHVDEAFNYRTVPLPAPTREEEVTILERSEDIINAIKQAMVAKYAAFDYETTTLQPEIEGANVLSAAVSYCNDKSKITTFAFLFMGDADIKRAWTQFLQSEVQKIGANIKFEHRWGLVKFKCETLNWLWDVCVGARVFNSQPGMSGLKLISFLYMGVIGYDDSVEDTKNKSVNGVNGLREVAPRVLLTYNGYDALLTLKCFFHQSALFKNRK